MKALLDRIGESQRQVIDRFNTEVLEHNVEVLSNQHDQAEVFMQIRQLMEAIMKMQKSGDALKAQFMAILEGYISSREAFTLMTSNREKEELINAVKAQVRLL